jgi:hypothetical protein
MLRHSGGREKTARRGAHQLHQEVRVGRNRQLSLFVISFIQVWRRFNEPHE